jgi:hypothetical protein
MTASYDDWPDQPSGVRRSCRCSLDLDGVLAGNDKGTTAAEPDAAEPL